MWRSRAYPGSLGDREDLRFSVYILAYDFYMKRIMAHARRPPWRSDWAPFWAVVKPFEVKCAFMDRPSNRTLISVRNRDVRRVTPSRVLELSARATVKTRPIMCRERKV